MLHLARLHHLLLKHLVLVKHLVDLLLLLPLTLRHDLALNLAQLLANLVHVVQLILDVKVFAQDHVGLLYLAVDLVGKLLIEARLLPASLVLLRDGCLGQ